MMEKLAAQMTRLFGARGWEVWRLKSFADTVNLALTREVAEDLARILECLNNIAPEVVSRETED
jgi:Arc/MetJ family transcription regulator